MQLRPQYPVLTPRLSLRPFTAADLDDMLVYRGRADVCRYLPFEPQTRAQLAEALTGEIFGRTDLLDEGQALTLGVRSRLTGQLLGDVILFFRSRQRRGGEIGWVFDPAQSGQGYATEAARAVLGLAFGDLGLRRVIARLDARNEPSARLCRRLGMRFESRREREELFKGERSELLSYELTHDTRLAGPVDMQPR